MFEAHESMTLTDELHVKIDKEWNKYKEGYSHPLARAMIMTFKTDMIKDACYHIIQACLHMASPLLIKYIIDFANGDDKESEMSFGFICAALLVICQFATNVIGSHHGVLGHNLSQRREAAVKSLVVKKTLNISAATNKDYS